MFFRQSKPALHKAGLLVVLLVLQLWEVPFYKMHFRAATIATLRCEQIHFNKICSLDLANHLAKTCRPTQADTLHYHSRSVSYFAVVFDYYKAVKRLLKLNFYFVSTFSLSTNFMKLLFYYRHLSVFQSRFLFQYHY